MLLSMSSCDGKYVIYDNLAELLKRTRLLSVKDFMLDQMSGDNKIEAALVNVLHEAETTQVPSTKPGYMSIQDVRKALVALQKTSLTKMQIFSLVSGVPMVNDLVDCSAFIPIAVRAIERMFDPASLQQKQILMQRAEVSPVEMMVCLI